MLNSIVRDALLTSVMCRAWPVSFQISHVSTVPKASLPASARARAPGTLSRIQRILLAEKYASMSRPVFAWIVSPAPSAFSRSQNSAVRRSCQTIALWIGSPVSRSQTMVVSRWLVMPMAAMSFGRDLRAAERLDGDADLRRPDLLRVVLDPAGLRKDLREFLLRHRL